MIAFSEWHGFPYLPRFGQRVCRVRGKGMASQTLTKPLPVTWVSRCSYYFILFSHLPCFSWNNIRFYYTVSVTDRSRCR
jgi:hypothetical protein